MRRLNSLDGLRGLLAVYVMLGHMAPFAVLPDWVQAAVSHGNAAVDLFFVLSGLVIVQSLARADGRAAPFLIARVARIFPVYLVVLAVAVAVQPLSCGFESMPWIGADSPARSICSSAWPPDWPAELLAHLTMTHGLFPNAVLPDVWNSFLGSAWSLSTEWQFYLLALLSAGRDRRLCLILLGLGVTWAAWRLSGPEGWQFSRAFLGNKGGFFALGVASAGVARREVGASRRYAAVLLVCLTICAIERTAGKMLPPLVWTFFLAVEMEVVDMGLFRLVGAVLRGRIPAYLGTVSYCVYLVNEPIQKLAGATLALLTGGDGVVFTAVWIPLSVGLPLLAAGWLHRMLEAPALRRGRDLARRSAARRFVPAVQARGPGL